MAAKRKETTGGNIGDAEVTNKVKRNTVKVVLGSLILLVGFAICLAFIGGVIAFGLYFFNITSVPGIIGFSLGVIGVGYLMYWLEQKLRQKLGGGKKVKTRDDDYKTLL